MNPNLLSQMTSQHVDEARRSASARTPARAPGAGPAAAIRTRAGWALVDLGLRLAVRSADA